MWEKLKHDWQPNHGIIFAQTACFCLGLSLIFWAAGPLLVHVFAPRAVSGFVMLNAFTFVMGGVLLGLQQLISLRIVWATWTLLGLASMIALSALLDTLLVTGVNSNTLLVPVCGVTALSAVLALADLGAWDFLFVNPTDARPRTEAPPPRTAARRSQTPTGYTTMGRRSKRKHRKHAAAHGH